MPLTSSVPGFHREKREIARHHPWFIPPARGAFFVLIHAVRYRNVAVAGLPNRLRLI